MRGVQLRLALGLLVLAGTVSGCRGYDALFGVMSNHYTDGGVNVFDKQRHYQERVEQLHDASQ